MAGIKDILDWAHEHGEPRVIDRIRLMVFPSLIRERIVLSRIDASTTCSPALLNELRAAASEAVGKPCPL